MVDKNVHNFIADKLSEVVLTKHHRQKTMISALTMFGMVFLATFSGFSFLKGETFLAIALSIYTCFACFTIWALSRWNAIGLVSLTIIIYTLSLFLILTGGYEGTGTMWVYPLTAIGVFINRFKHGLVLTILFILVIIVVFILDLPKHDYSLLVSIRFVITLIALSGMCHILIYFQSQMDDYILKMHEEGVDQLAYIDSLTTLANRSSFNSVLFHSMQLGHSPLSAVVYIDLDNFKSINDNYGHSYGDQVLSEFGKSLKQIVSQQIGESIGPYDVARIGGDEFAVYIKEYSSEKQVVGIAEEVIALFTQKKLKSLQKIHNDVNASIGVVFVDTQTLNLNDCLHLADKAMYQAKNAGKGRYRIIKTEHSHTQD